jgi:hypothetical protein
MQREAFLIPAPLPLTGLGQRLTLVIDLNQPPPRLGLMRGLRALQQIGQGRDPGLALGQGRAALVQCGLVLGQRLGESGALALPVLLHLLQPGHDLLGGTGLSLPLIALALTALQGFTQTLLAVLQRADPCGQFRAALLQLLAARFGIGQTLRQIGALSLQGAGVLVGGEQFGLSLLQRLRVPVTLGERLIALALQGLARLRECGQLLIAASSCASICARSSVHCACAV